uniref:Uncharacterized protein n=1 Tax=Chrysotila carterae TaxID=13221 RepID=A0A7S4F442_CHRCT
MPSSLHADCCKCGDEGCKALGEALKSNHTLFQLNFEGCREWGCHRAGEIGHTALAEALKSNRGLSRVNLRHLWMNDSSIEEFVKAVQINTNLLTLEMTLNGSPYRCDSSKYDEIARRLKENALFRFETIALVLEHAVFLGGKEIPDELKVMIVRNFATSEFQY